MATFENTTQSMQLKSLENESPFSGAGYSTKRQKIKKIIRLSEILTVEEQEEYIRRYQLRSIALRATAVRYEIPIENVENYIETDTLTEDQINRLLHKKVEIPDAIVEGVEDLTAPFDAEENPAQEEDERTTAVKQQLLKAYENLGLTEAEAVKVQEVVKKHEKAVLRTKFGNDPAAKLTPLKIQLRSDAKPRRMKFFNLTPKTREALEDTVRDLLAKGLIRENKTARWLSNMMIIPKPKNNPNDPTEETRYRCVLDLRYINKQTIPIMYPTTDLEQALQACRGAKYFIALDLLKGFWQCAIDEQSQEYFSFGTPNTVYSYTRLPMGATDSAIWFNQQVREVFKDLIEQKKVIVYIDDILGFASTFDEYVELLDTILARCKQFGILANAKKCTLGASKIHFCGRDIDANGF
jgi:hypothetical protein